MKEYHKIQTVFKRNPDTKFKTLLEGVFSLPEFEYLKDNWWTFTEKVDGTNIRIMWDGESLELKFGGKTDRADIPADLTNQLNRLFPKEKFKEYESMCLYGEGFGAKIQKGGGNYGQTQNFVLFDVKIGEWWLQRKDVEDIANKFGLLIIPIIGSGTLQDMIERVREGFNSQWGDFLAEGIVAKPRTELKARSGHRIITKLKHKDFPKN